MPTVLSDEFYDCGVAPQSVTIRKIKTVYDNVGTGVLVWDLDSGVLPTDMVNNFEVYQNGKRLDYIQEYTKQDFTTTVTSTITIVYPIPQAYYTLIKYG